MFYLTAFIELISLLKYLLAKECCRRATRDAAANVVANFVVTLVEYNNLVLRCTTEELLLATL